MKFSFEGESPNLMFQIMSLILSFKKSVYGWCPELFMILSGFKQIKVYFP